jgi:hypothetical protein
MITIREVGRDDAALWLRMRQALRPEGSEFFVTVLPIMYAPISLKRRLPMHPDSPMRCPCYLQ